jgi:hypothetical protein
MRRKSLFLAVWLAVSPAGVPAFAQAGPKGFHAGALVGNTDGTFDLKNAPLATAPGSSVSGGFAGTRAWSAPKFSVHSWTYGVTAGYTERRGPWLTGVGPHVPYGGGGEWQVNDRWSMKADHLFLDGGKKVFATRYPDGATGSAGVDFDFDLRRAGVNYRF